MYTKDIKNEFISNFETCRILINSCSWLANFFSTSNSAQYRKSNSSFSSMIAINYILHYLNNQHCKGYKHRSECSCLIIFVSFSAKLHTVAAETINRDKTPTLWKQGKKSLDLKRYTIGHHGLNMMKMVAICILKDTKRFLPLSRGLLYYYKTRNHYDTKQQSTKCSNSQIFNKYGAQNKKKWGTQM